MKNEAAFLKAIAAGDDTARLAFADWLEERGDERAPWVRDPAIFRWMGPRAENPVPALMKALRGRIPTPPIWPSSPWGRRRPPTCSPPSAPGASRPSGREASWA